MKDLIERLEALSGPCRECDEAISLLVRGWGHDTELRQLYGPAYTGSIDAAMTLVPEGCRWLRKDLTSMTVVVDDPNEKTWARHIDGVHKSPAIALCIASLKARGSAND